MSSFDPRTPDMEWDLALGELARLHRDHPFLIRFFTHLPLQAITPDDWVLQGAGTGLNTSHGAIPDSLKSWIYARLGQIVDVRRGDIFRLASECQLTDYEKLGVISGGETYRNLALYFDIRETRSMKEAAGMAFLQSFEAWRKTLEKALAYETKGDTKSARRALLNVLFDRGVLTKDGLWVEGYQDYSSWVT